MRRIAVIDIGTNSIKCLVAIESRQGAIASVYENTLPVRIGKGLEENASKLGAEQILAGAEAAIQLYGECHRHGEVQEVLIVGTSSLRDAGNASEFAHLIYNQTGAPLRILTGDDEARLIGRGVLQDPLVTGQFDELTVADLGGGSLELIALAGADVQARVSLPLGAVRLGERCIHDPHQKLDDGEAAQIDQCVRECIRKSGFPLRAPLIGTGGMVTVWRSIEAHQQGVTLPELSPILTRSSLQDWIGKIRKMDWSERLSIPGLPASRADIILPGMLILEAVLDLANAKEVTHSRFNLRVGLAAEWFAEHPEG